MPMRLRSRCSGSASPRAARGRIASCSGRACWAMRCPPKSPVQWEVAEDEGFKTIVARGTEQAEPGTAHSVHAEPSGLRPDRWYWYRFRALGQESAAGRTRTTPAADARPASLRFSIASCQRWDHGEYAAWSDMAKQDLDLVLFLGDYIYESATAASTARRRAAATPAGPATHWTTTAPATRSTRAIRACRRCMPTRHGSSSGTTTRSRTTGPAMSRRTWPRTSINAASPPRRRTGSTSRSRHRCGPRAWTSCSAIASTGAAWHG